MLDHIWRVCATGFSFAVFGIGGLILGMVIFPLLSLGIRETREKNRLARLAIHHSFRFFIGLMRLLGLLSYDISGIERLNRRGLLILANHPTLIDVVFLISLVPNANCIVKSDLAHNPFTRGQVRATGYICNDTGVELVNDCVAALRSGDNLIIFPEGTRTPVDGKIVLKRGSAHVAINGMRPITPVRISCKPRSLTKGLPWWQIPPTSVHFTISVQEDILVNKFSEKDNPVLASRRLTEYLESYFRLSKA